MKSSFTIKEKRKFMLKKHIKNHLFEYVLDFIGPMIFTTVLLYLCKAENYIYGFIVSFVYSGIKLIHNIYCYKKYYLDIEIKESLD